MDEELRNGNIDLSALNSKVGNPDLIRFLEATLASAKSGHITTIAMVQTHGSEINISVVGEVNAGVVAGLEHLKAQIVQGMFGQPRPSGSLVVPGLPGGGRGMRR